MKLIKNYIIAGFALLAGSLLIYSFYSADENKNSGKAVAVSDEEQYLAVADSLDLMAEARELLDISIQIDNLNCMLLELEDDVELLHSTTKASYYHDKFVGRKTANGEIFSNDKLTAAHKTLPFGTRVKVTNLSTDKSVVVTINDRGPFIKGRQIDLSKAAFKEITARNTTRKGILDVKIELLPDGYEDTLDELLSDLEELETIVQLKETERSTLKEFSL